MELKYNYNVESTDETLNDFKIGRNRDKSLEFDRAQWTGLVRHSSHPFKFDSSSIDMDLGLEMRSSNLLNDSFSYHYELKCKCDLSLMKEKSNETKKTNLVL